MPSSRRTPAPRPPATRAPARTSPLGPDLGPAWGGLLRVHARLTARLDAELRAAHDTPLAWFDALFQLSLVPGARCRLSDLGERVLLTPSGISRLVDRLEAEGLVRRATDTEDGRAVTVALTARGRERLEAVRPTHVAGIRRHFAAHATTAELRVLAALWPRILAALDDG